MTPAVLFNGRVSFAEVHVTHEGRTPHEDDLVQLISVGERALPTSQLIPPAVGETQGVTTQSSGSLNPSRPSVAASSTGSQSDESVMPLPKAPPPTHLENITTPSPPPLNSAAEVPVVQSGPAKAPPPELSTPAPAVRSSTTSRAPTLIMVTPIADSRREVASSRTRELDASKEENNSRCKSDKSKRASTPTPKRLRSSSGRTLPVPDLDDDDEDANQSREEENGRTQAGGGSGSGHRNPLANFQRFPGGGRSTSPSAYSHHSDATVAPSNATHSDLTCSHDPELIRTTGVIYNLQQPTEESGWLLINHLCDGIFPSRGDVICGPVQSPSLREREA